MTTRGDNRADDLTASSPWLRSWDPSLIFEGGESSGGVLSLGLKPVHWVDGTINSWIFCPNIKAWAEKTKM